MLQASRENNWREFPVPSDSPPDFPEFPPVILPPLIFPPVILSGSSQPAQPVVHLRKSFPPVIPPPHQLFGGQLLLPPVILFAG